MKPKIFECPVQPGSAERGKVKGSKLEDQLASQLERARIGSGGNLACLTTVEPSVETAVLSGATELRVVPGVERVGTELESRSARLAEDELLEQRQVPVLAPRSTQSIEGQIAPSPCRRCGGR